MAIEAEVARHYGTAGIAERILAALRAAQGAAAPVTPDALAPADHFHGGGIAATRELVAILEPQKGERLLDIGSGIGGPARWIAATFGVHVTGVDLTPEFCAAADELNRATGLAERVRIINGSALDLPVPDNEFDRAYSQNAIMNIGDKPRFYREAFRALRPGGVFAIANACAGPAGEPYYPQMWAATAATSFLATPDETRRDIAAAGFAIAAFRDTTSTRLPTQTRQAQQLERGTAAPLGIHVLMGADVVREAMQNSARSLAGGRIVMIEALLRKPA
jgi:ubiquinone/menaquinone biosynthesis C-methylase UbiE